MSSRAKSAQKQLNTDYHYSFQLADGSGPARLQKIRSLDCSRLLEATHIPDLSCLSTGVPGGAVDVGGVLYAALQPLLKADLCHLIDAARETTSAWHRQANDFLTSEEYWNTIVEIWKKDAPWTGLLDEAPPTECAAQLTDLFKGDDKKPWFDETQHRPSLLDRLPLVQAACEQMAARWMKLVDEVDFDKESFWKKCLEGATFDVTKSARVPRIPVWTREQLQSILSTPAGSENTIQNHAVAVLESPPHMKSHYYISPLGRDSSLCSEWQVLALWTSHPKFTTTVATVYHMRCASKTPFTPTNPPHQIESLSTPESLKEKDPIDPTDNLRRQWLSERTKNDVQANNTRAKLLSLRIELLKTVCWEIDLRQRIVKTVAVIMDVLEDVGTFRNGVLARLVDTNQASEVGLRAAATEALHKLQKRMQILCKQAGATDSMVNYTNAGSLLSWLPVFDNKHDITNSSWLLVSSARLAAKAFLLVHESTELRIGYIPTSVQDLKTKWKDQTSEVEKMTPATGGLWSVSDLRAQNEKKRQQRRQEREGVDLSTVSTSAQLSGPGYCGHGLLRDQPQEDVS